MQQHGEALLLWLYGPIELRREVIQPAVRQPFARVGIEFGVRVVACDLRRISRPPDAKRADAEFHPRFGGFDGFIHATDEGVDVLAPPIVAAQLSAGAK